MEILLLAKFLNRPFIQPASRMHFYAAGHHATERRWCSHMSK
ncbi:hypothetical protein ACLK19_04910 [Escherichia coli]